MTRIVKVKEGDSIPANAKFLYSTEETDLKLGGKGRKIKYNWFEVEGQDFDAAIGNVPFDKTIKINLRK